MQAHAIDAGVFIRSMATRGHLGGLAAATGHAVDLLAAAGKDVILVETVGVGQDEVEIVGRRRRQRGGARARAWATRCRRSRPGSWRSPTSSWSTRPTARASTAWWRRSSPCSRWPRTRARRRAIVQDGGHRATRASPSCWRRWRLPRRARERAGCSTRKRRAHLRQQFEETLQARLLAGCASARPRRPTRARGGPPGRARDRSLHRRGGGPAAHGPGRGARDPTSTTWGSRCPTWSRRPRLRGARLPRRRDPRRAHREGARRRSCPWGSRTSSCSSPPTRRRSSRASWRSARAAPRLRAGRGHPGRAGRAEGGGRGAPRRDAAGRAPAAARWRSCIRARRRACCWSSRRGRSREAPRARTGVRRRRHRVVASGARAGSDVLLRHPGGAARPRRPRQEGPPRRGPASAGAPGLRRWPALRDRVVPSRAASRSERLPRASARRSTSGAGRPGRRGGGAVTGEPRGAGLRRAARRDGAAGPARRPRPDFARVPGEHVVRGLQGGPRHALAAAVHERRGPARFGGGLRDDRGRRAARRGRGRSAPGPTPRRSPRQPGRRPGRPTSTSGASARP